MIHIRVSQEGDFVQVSIEDNGIGRKRSRIENLRKERYHKSVASANVARRIELINQQFPGKMEYWVEDLEDVNGRPTGTLVVFKYNWLFSQQ